MRVLLLTHEDLARSPQRTESSFVSALEQLISVDIRFWDPAMGSAPLPASLGRGPGDGLYDAVIVFVRFRELHASSAVDWAGFSGMRVWIEHDAWNAFSPAHPQWHGKYQEAFKRHRFDLMVSTGKKTTARLVEDGVDAVWIPKAFSSETFHDLGLERSGLCTFGTRWPARRAVVDLLDRNGIAIADVSGPFDTLNDRLNRHSAAVVCNMPATTPLGKLGRAARRVRPGFVRLHPAVEPMIKTFEVAAAGCAPIVDEVEDLHDLGFHGGTTCLIYSSLEELVDLTLSTSREEQIAIGRSAAEVAADRHTWAHRAADLVRVLRARLRSS